MFSDTEIPRETIQAYLETEYFAFDDASMALKIGEPNSKLAALHTAHGVTCSAFITACNPFSQACSAKFNADRQHALARDLENLGLVAIDGMGKHPSNNWPGEASFLVLGLPLDAAKALGTQYGQNAIVWSAADATPQLILLR
ncbi:DUF3293 domain-containing protein [Paraburkholderia phymatum]|uniref:DUF3293 domain-containing protein n=1 Tax=Paraburkholderia phymatum (strain DSM 17167 / CIP 108236 / LMG 21445 / STM815) TaxID=391038 RepID=B2JT39_PARP8|nr:DUF3293 domain-containing protein [Paraburkholderia phymatum]ACC75742.1 conserved hypothetical protein [Paraburkholderia phymatum STM815]